VNGLRLTYVRLLGLPAELMERARRHHDAVLRELALIEFSDATTATTHDPELMRLAGCLRDVYGELMLLRAAVIQAVESLPTTGPDLRVDVEMELPLDFRDMAAAARAFDEIDEWCAAGRLLSFPTSPEIRRLRRWYFGEIERQLGGESPTRWDDASSPAPGDRPAGRERPG